MLVTYGLVRASPERGCFRVLHPNESVRPMEVRAGVRGPHKKNLRFFLWGGLAHNFVSASVVDAHVLKVRSASRQRRFRVLHPNESVRPQAFLKRPQTRRFSFEDGITRTPSVTSHDTTLSRSKWSLVAIRSYSSPYAALRRSARLSRGCSSSRRENAETLVHSAFCKQNYLFARSFSLRVYESG